MKVTVIAFSEAESYRAEAGLTKLTRGVNRFKRDLRDRRVDQSTVESFVRGLKNLARNPTGFRRWDEWLGVLHG